MSDAGVFDLAGRLEHDDRGNAGEAISTTNSIHEQVNIRLYGEVSMAPLSSPLCRGRAVPRARVGIPSQTSKGAARSLRGKGQARFRFLCRTYGFDRWTGIRRCWSDGNRSSNSKERMSGRRVSLPHSCRIAICAGRHSRNSSNNRLPKHWFAWKSYVVVDFLYAG